MAKNSMDSRPPSMRHRAWKDELGQVDPDRGSEGGRDLVRSLPDEKTFHVVSRSLGATRAVGLPLGGVPELDSVRTLGEKLDEILKASKTKVTGPLMSLLLDNPFATMAPDRRYVVARTIQGPAPVAEGLERVRLEGGSYLVLPRVGRIDDLEPEYGFVFGRWMPSMNYELARPQIREVYTQGLEVDDPAGVPMEILFPIAMYMSPDPPRYED